MENNNDFMDTIRNKKIDNYGFEENNYIIPEEITLTITLREYRDLVSKCAVADTAIKHAEENKWQREQENKKLKEEMAELRKWIREITSKTATNTIDGVCVIPCGDNIS